MTEQRDVSIRRRLTIWLFAAALMGAGSASAFLLLADSDGWRTEALRDAQVSADLAAANLGAALIFEDGKGARAVLATLAARPAIARAEARTLSGQPLAAFANPGPAGVTATSDVMWSGEKVGSVAVEQRREGVNWGRHAVAAAQAVLAAALLGWLLAAVLHGSLTLPLIDLAATASFIHRERDFSVRLPNRHSGEAGRLVDAFNAMMTVVQDRERESDNHRRLLEQQIKRLESEKRAAPSAVTSTALPAVADELDGVRLVLAVDDPSGGVASQLEQWGARVDRAPDARRAVARCARADFDAVIADTSICTADGVSLPARILSLYPGIRLVIVVTGEPGPALCVPGVAQVGRPLEASALLQAIREVASRVS